MCADYRATVKTTATHKAGSRSKVRKSRRERETEKERERVVRSLQVWTGPTPGCSSVPVGVEGPGWRPLFGSVWFWSLKAGSVN